MYAHTHRRRGEGDGKITNEWRENRWMWRREVRVSGGERQNAFPGFGWMERGWICGCMYVWIDRWQEVIGHFCNTPPFSQLQTHTFAHNWPRRVKTAAAHRRGWFSLTGRQIGATTGLVFQRLRHSIKYKYSGFWFFCIILQTLRQIIQPHFLLSLETTASLE